MPTQPISGLIYDSRLRQLVHEAGADQGHRVQWFESCEALLSALRAGKWNPDLLFLDPVRLTSREEVELLKVLRDSQIIVCLLLSPGYSYGSAGLTSLGNVRVLTKPILRRDIQGVMENVELELSLSSNEPLGSITRPVWLPNPCEPEMEPQPLIEELGDQRVFLALSPAMLNIYRQVNLLRGIDVSVLILGESGTGKEIVAHLIHKHSRRRQQRLVNVNCAALPVDLLESELFGYVKGAFTGAITDKPGRFEQANGGTILLDEIGEISTSIQAKLLHVLQDGQFTRLGDRQSTRVDVHVLAATNAPMEEALAHKTFREDLYYRLNAFTIEVPPLRERTVEIPYLVKLMISQSPLAQLKGVTHFSQELMDVLPEYSWPGNLRELRNFVIRTLILQDETAAKVELERKIEQSSKTRHASVTPEPFRAAPMRSAVREARSQAEARIISEALHECGWNRRKAARCLNISYRGLLYKIKRYGLSPNSQPAFDNSDPSQICRSSFRGVRSD